MTALLDFPTTPVLGAPASRSDVDEFLAYKQAQTAADSGATGFDFDQYPACKRMRTGEGNDQQHTAPDSADSILFDERVYIRPRTGADLEAYLAWADLEEARAYIRDLVGEIDWLIRHGHEAIVRTPPTPWTAPTED